jgi:hypothetical protein
MEAVLLMPKAVPSSPVNVKQEGQEELSRTRAELLHRLSMKLR